MSHSTSPSARGPTIIQRSAPSIQCRYLSSGLILGALVALHLVVALLDLATHFLAESIGSDEFRRIFNSDAESSLPTWVSTTQLFVAAAIPAIISAFEYSARRPYAGHWLLLSLVLLAISLDEVAAVHEISTLVLGVEIDALGGSSWVIPFAILTGLLLVVFIPFLRSLPADTLMLFLLAGGIAVAGGMGLEIVAALVLEGGAAEGGDRGILLRGLEELMERIGIAVFIYAVLRHIAQHTGLARIVFPGERTELRLE